MCRWEVGAILVVWLTSLQLLLYISCAAINLLYIQCFNINPWMIILLINTTDSLMTINLCYASPFDSSIFEVYLF